jgi:DNA-binding NarL/FixJ family response regulator
MNRMIRILIADDQELVRYGLCELLEFEPDLEVVGEATNGTDAVFQTLTLNPDVLLLDLLMPGLSSMNAIIELTHSRPQTRILVLTGLMDEEVIIQALQSGAVGILPKTASPSELVQAIRAAAGGGVLLHPLVASVVVRRLNQPATEITPGPHLTSREREILFLLTRGQSNNEIARELAISQYTVRTHICTVLKKLNLAYRTQAALHALRSGIARLAEL